MKLRNQKLKKQVEDEQRFSKSLESKIELDKKLVIRQIKEKEQGKSQNSNKYHIILTIDILGLQFTVYYSTITYILTFFPEFLTEKDELRARISYLESQLETEETFEPQHHPSDSSFEVEKYNFYNFSNS